MSKINIGYLQSDKILSENMYITAKPLYKSFDIDFNKLHRVVKSDKIQYSPFNFIGGTKKSDNWNNSNQDLLILDIDDGLTIIEAKEKFSKYKYLLCTTKSHRKEKQGKVCDRFRIIIKAKNIPRNDSYFDYMKRLEKIYPFIDKQVNTKTGAFLGFANCEYWYNEGKEFDFEILNIQDFPKAAEVIQQKRNYENDDLNIQAVKDSLTPEILREIIIHQGFEVDRNFKFSVRNERTPSCSISSKCVIVDFGGVAYGDIFNFLKVEKGMSFIDAVNTVKNYV